MLGANDGILSTSSPIIGIASANGTHQSLLIAGVSGLVAGAMTMASGEYVSISSQSDAETADVAREGRELVDNRGGETRELADIYVKRGPDPALAMTVAGQLMGHDALGVDTRDELGISYQTWPRHVRSRHRSHPRRHFRPVECPGADSTRGTGCFGDFNGIRRFTGIACGAGRRRRQSRRNRYGFPRHFLAALAMAVTAGIGAVLGARL